MSINIVYSINKKRRSWRLSIQTHLLIDLLALTDHENHIKGDKVSFRHDNVLFFRVDCSSILDCQIFHQKLRYFERIRIKDLISNDYNLHISRLHKIAN